MKHYPGVLSHSAKLSLSLFIAQFILTELYRQIKAGARNEQKI
jgi:hypothetical protein